MLFVLLEKSNGNDLKICLLFSGCCVWNILIGNDTVSYIVKYETILYKIYTEHKSYQSKKRRIIIVYYKPATNIWKKKKLLFIRLYSAEIFVFFVHVMWIIFTTCTHGFIYMYTSLYIRETYEHFCGSI